MKKGIIIITIMGICIMSACSKKEASKEVAEQPVEQEQDAPEERVVLVDTIDFFGKAIIANDSVWEQLAASFPSDCNIKVYENENGVNVVNIAGTEFACNSGFMLMSSKKVSSKEIQKVVAYISTYYGKGEEDEPENYLWASMYQEDNNGKDYYVRLRNVHSEDGGTVILFK